jgi:hypothetical protein
MLLCRPFITPETTSPCALVTHVNYDRSFPVNFPLSVPVAPFTGEIALESRSNGCNTFKRSSEGERNWQYLGSRSVAMQTQIATQDHGRRNTFHVEISQLSAATKVTVACRCRPYGNMVGNSTAQDSETSKRLNSVMRTISAM